MNLWFSSDWHYGHKNLVKGSSEWDDLSACRDFPTLKEHDEFLIQQINTNVKSGDILYFLGDWSFGGEDNVWKLRARIDCETIHFIGGNHDHFIRRNKILSTDRGLVHARNLFSSYNEILEKDIGKQTVIMCHYALRTWHKARKGSWMLHGHSHGSLGNYLALSDTSKAGEMYKQLDVGIDCHPEFRPFHLDEVKQFMSQCINLGHHERS